MKCAISGKEIGKNFLEKPLGTIIKDEKGKKYFISSEAQAQFRNDKKEILKKIHE